MGNGSGDKRTVRLRVIGGSVDLRNDVPKTRAECPTKRPCGHVRCRWHMWLEIDDGRPWHGTRYTLRPVWWEWPLPPSCGLDLVERTRELEHRGMTSEEIARVMGKHTTLVQRRIREALRRLKEMGFDIRDLLGEIDGVP